MDKGKEKEYLKQIEQLVIDECQVVTYKWVSRTLDLHVNKSKSLLAKFLSNCVKSYGDGISSTHLISGKKKDGTCSVEIVTDTKLEESRAMFDTIWSEHVYSVQKTMALDDYQALYIVDTFDKTSNWKATPIKCSLAVEKSTSDVQVTSAGLERKPLAKVTQNLSKKEIVEPKKDIAKSEKKDEVKETTKKQDETKETAKKQDVKIEKPGKKANSISSMFSAQQKKPQAAKKAAIVKTEEVGIKEVPADEPKEKSNPKENKKRKRPQKKINVAIKEENKRKRIMMASESDDSDNDVERIASPEPESDPEPPASVEIISEDEEKSTTSASHKKKKRKMVEKQELDEQGYLITTKEYSLETDSEPEPEPAPKIEKKSPAASKNPPPATKKSASPKKGKGKAAPSDGRKQQSLLSFFKKT